MAHITRSYMSDAQIERFLRDVSVDETGCWPWQGYRNDQDYGHTNFRDTTLRLAPRVSHLVFHGYLDSELSIDHLCAVTRCVNPDHLELVTMAENNRRQFVRRRAERQPEINRVVAAYGSGLTTYQISDAFQMPYSTVRRRLREGGVAMRRPGPTGPTGPRKKTSSNR